MNALPDMIWIEYCKVRRSKMPLMTAMGSMFVPLGIAFLIFISKNPNLARKLGLISAKAELISASVINWPSYLTTFAQMIAMAGMFLYVLIISWVFGREFVDGTLKDMLAVPVPRASILLAKFIVAAAWAGVVTILLFSVGLAVGAVIRLPQGSWNELLQGCGLTALTTLLTITVCLPFALLASTGRGYLLPLGGAILALILANVAMVAGWGEIFPWAIPGLLTTLQGKGASLPAISYWVALLTGFAGIAATYAWWMWADQNR